MTDISINRLGELCTIREEAVDGVGPWVWIKEDAGAWWGPKKDWEGSHKYLIKDVPSKRTVIQAGGCMGMYPRLLARDFEAVYTFEPDALNFYALSHNCQADNIFKYQAFLGNEHGFFNIRRCAHGDVPRCVNFGEHHLDPDTQKVGYTPMLRIDDFEFWDVDLIWLDIEGLEIEALKGAEETIKAWHPWVLVENGGGVDGNMDIPKFLAGLGYNPYSQQSAMDWLYKPK